MKGTFGELLLPALNMPKTPIRTVDTSLPHANLFLDDLEEIERLFRDALSSKEIPKESFKFVYLVDGAYRFDSIEELREHGGRFGRLSISIEPVGDNSPLLAHGNALVFYPKWTASLFIPYILKDSEWELVGRIRQIFNSRRNVWRITERRFAIPLAFTGLAATAIGSYMVGATFETAKPGNHWIGIVGYSLIALLGWVLWGSFFIGSGLSRNTVAFYYQRSNYHERQARRKEWVEKVIYMFLGALIYGIVGHLLKRIW